MEAYFNDAVVALFATTALIKHKRAEADETARLEAVAAEQRRREEARRERANNRAKYLKKKADDYAELVKLDAFASQLELRTKPHGQAGIDRIAGELRARLETMRDGFSREAMNTEISKLGLYTEDDGNGFEHPFA